MKSASDNGVPSAAPRTLSDQSAPVDLQVNSDKAGEGSPLPKGFWPWVIIILGVSASLFQLYTGGFGIFSSMIQRSVHWMFMSVLAFLIYRVRRDSDRQTPTVADIFFALLSLTAGIYIFFNWEAVVDRAGMPIERDIYFGIIMIVIVLEATRRVVGATLAVTSLAFLVYAFVGPWMPGIFKHNGYDLERVINVMYTSTEGIFGIPMAVSSTYIVLFVLFGSFLGKSGGGKFFIDFAFSVTGRARGGPAKAAVISSALMGTMSGAAVANVVTTGTFTIPLMKRCGYSAIAAGAIEAVASTGGQIMPPIMGAAAFIMSEFTEIPYAQIAAAAVIPAFLYFFSVYRMVDAQARKQGLKALPREALPQIGATLVWGGHLFVPLFTLIGLLIWGYSPMKSVFWSIVLIVVMGTSRKTTRVCPWKFVEALAYGARNAVTISVACASAGIIVGVIALTGLGLKFSDSLISLSGGKNVTGHIDQEHLVVNMENILTWNPEVIVMWYNDRKNAEDIMKNALWHSVSAVNDHKVFEFPDVFSCDLWTLKYLHAVALVSKWCYPDVFTDMDTEKYKWDLLQRFYGEKLDPQHVERLQIKALN